MTNKRIVELIDEITERMDSIKSANDRHRDLTRELRGVQLGLCYANFLLKGERDPDSKGMSAEDEIHSIMSIMSNAYDGLGEPDGD